MDGPGTTITLVSNYSGVGVTSKAVRRGDDTALPLAVNPLPSGGSGSFTDWHGTLGGKITDTVPEPTP